MFLLRWIENTDFINSFVNCYTNDKKIKLNFVSIFKQLWPFDEGIIVHNMSLLKTRLFGYTHYLQNMSWFFFTHQVCRCIKLKKKNIIQQESKAQQLNISDICALNDIKNKSAKPVKRLIYLFKYFWFEIQYLSKFRNIF